MSWMGPRPARCAVTAQQRRGTHSLERAQPLPNGEEEGNRFALPHNGPDKGSLWICEYSELRQSPLTGVQPGVPRLVVYFREDSK